MAPATSRQPTAEEAAAMAKLNAKTGPMREQAFENIRTLGTQDEMTQPLREEIERIKNIKNPMLLINFKNVRGYIKIIR